MRNQHVFIHADASSLLTPSHTIKILQTANPDPPVPPLTQMVVNLRSAHSKPSEVKNIIANPVNVMLFETSIKADPLLYELTNPIQDEQGHRT